MKSPVTLGDFHRTFPSERQCWRQLRRMRWPGGFRCPQSGHGRSHRASAARLDVLEGVSKEDLFPFIRGVIDGHRTTVATDGMPTYKRLAATGVRHDRRIQRTARRAAEILPWVHTVTGNLKTWLRGTFHGVSRKHLPSYLDEFSYRFNRRWRETEIFGFVLRRLAHGEPVQLVQSARRFARQRRDRRRSAAPPRRSRSRRPSLHRGHRVPAPGL